MAESLKIHVTSLGCPKNLADTERILAVLKEALPDISFEKDHKNASIFLVNTCAFIEDAVQESIDRILELCQEKGKGQHLVVFGCMPLRYGLQLEKLIPEVDRFIFHVEPDRIASEILGLLSRKTAPLVPSHKRLVTGKPWQVFVKISDGCSNRCTYCLIPKIRGGLKCRSPKDIVKEINEAVSLGAVEITLVAQDLTAYQYEGIDLPALIRLILKETDCRWLRLMYLYPEGIDQELLELVAKEDRICNYLDVPIQHTSDRVLKRMGRPGNGAKLNRKLETIRSFLPDASLRTTVMVGFPGEEDKDYRTLVDFIKRWRFHHLGCFVYSDEQEAYSRLFKDKVAKEVAIARKEELMEIQKGISRAINRDFIGKEIDVLIQGYCEESELLLCARSRFQAPEIDGITYINQGNSTEGSIERVKITQAFDYDIVGKIVPPITQTNFAAKG